MSNGKLHAREREDLALHVERCAERYTAVRAEICGLRKQTRRIEAAIWGIVAVLVALGAGGAQILPILRALPYWPLPIPAVSRGSPSKAARLNIAVWMNWPAQLRRCMARRMQRPGGRA